MGRKVRYILLIVVFFVAAVLLSGCEKKNQAPPKQMVQDALLANLPPYLSLDSIELESIPTGPESFKVNFKAIITPKEDLYQVDREVEGTPTVTLLKVIQTAGTEASLYGSLEAKRTMDLWTLESPQIEIGLQQFGLPRGTFPPHSYVIGSSEASAALKQQAANAAEEERARKLASERRERERKAQQESEARERKERQEREEKARIAREEQLKIEEEQRKKEEEEYHQKLILATSAGTRYIGTISHGDERQRLRLVFTEQDGVLIRAEASNPDRRGEKQTFIGELVFDPKPEKGKPDIVYPIVLSPIGKQDFPYDTFHGEVWRFYSQEGSLKLRLAAIGTTIGLDGEADMGGSMFSSGADYIIRLQREDAKVAPEDSIKIPPIPRDKNDDRERAREIRPRERERVRRSVQ